ncbi:hemolysin secretion protein D [Sphingomonas sp. Leaf16]|nr:hemolysin secretion protein D [Sphingomonas sp. Leaf16]KQN14905.1 hemolysin secretion protein D [Sphingomonas sp. Leaf29]KQN20438.1 hemolysin secretion protein D [Sphingomonas sp. Leaf32]
MSTRSAARTVPFIAVALAACSTPTPDPRTLPPLVRAMQPASASNATRKFTGVVAARVQSDLGFRVGGKVVERLVNAGQVVRRGQPLMRIDQTDLALATRASNETVEAARARARQTGADEARLRDLVGAGAVSASTYDQAKAAADSARAQLAAAQAQARVARNEGGYGVLVADADGTVVETLAEPGQVVGAGQVVVRIARSGPREASVQLPETVRPSIGSSAQARTYGGAAGGATLRQLSDAADPATRTFEARYVLGGAAAQAPFGSTVTIAFAGTAPGGDAQVNVEVPLAAIHDAGKGPGVWVLRPGKPVTVAWRPVRITGLGEETASIGGGLAPGDRIVAMGAHLLHQGQPVRVATK